MKDLIIVESPTKARTIGQYLGKNYQVLSSQGHVRDLPKNDLGVNVEKGFEPKFETRRTKNLTLLRKAAEGAQHIYLATDHDREGEAIAYDLYEVLKRVVKDDDAFSRLIFNEITKPAILEALTQASEIDLPKVEAQRTRRILDRLVGYLLSPLLSRILAGNRFAGLSAGRVQSVALRFLCDRESQITHFTPEEYWEIDAHLRNGEPFVASVTKKNGEKFQLKTEKEAQEAEEQIRAADISVSEVEEKERRRQPSAPFITSTLQQSASSQLGFSPKRTMRIAQELYEGIALAEGTSGLITYMRTDS
ncbi:DNA topoisomerase I, partial [Candidatus Bipolaricaulota bacterium]|nr:DNA topoisomerase I [Candidatus Bipolaricaulota bacterium]